MRSSQSVTRFTPASSGLGFITDLGYPTKMLVERLREVHTLVIETNHDEKLLQNDPHRPWPVKQRIMSRHGHLSNAAAAGVIEQLLPGKIERVVLGHLSPRLQYAGAGRRRDARAAGASGRADLEMYCALQNDISPTVSDRRNLSATISSRLRERAFLARERL